MVHEKGNKAKSASETARRMRAFFPERDREIATLSAAECATYYDDLTTRVSRTGKPL